jgi:hypothetical protein
MRLGGIYVDIRGKTDKYKRDLAGAKTMTEKASVTMQHAISNISFAAVAASAAAAGAVIAKFGLDGFRAVEKMRISVASLASTITSFSKKADTDLAGAYKEAVSYSEQLVLKMEEINAQTIATGDNLMAMVETMAQHGVLLDINNKKQVEGFKAIANALALVTQGMNAEIQFRQEIRALMTGQVRATDSLARLLKQKVGGELKTQIAQWREQGTLIENVGILLSGFQEGAKDLENTWTAVGTTLSTMYNRTLRGLMVPVYEDIIALGKQITLNALDSNSAFNQTGTILRTVVYRAWQDIKNITESTLDLVMAFKDPLELIGKLIGMILDGWGQIFAILPAITERVKLITQSVFDSVKMIGHFADALWKVMSLDFAGARQAMIGAKADWIASGEKVGKAFSSGFLDEIDARLAEYNKSLEIKQTSSVNVPELKAQTAAQSKEALKAAEDLRQARLRAFKEEERLRAEKWQQEIEMMNAEIEKEKEAEEARLAIVKDFNEQYNELGKTRFELERERLAEQVKMWEEAGVEQNRIAELVSARNIDIARREQAAKLDIYQNIAGGIADTFQQVAQAGGRYSKEAFLAYQAFAIAEAVIAGHKAFSMTMADETIPSTFARMAMAGVVLAQTMAKVGMIAAASPPSYDTGGISSARGVYQTGDIKEAHVPIPSGKIPVEINGGESSPPEVNIFNTIDPSVMDTWAASARGQNAIFNSLGSQPQKLRRLSR